MYVWLVCKLHHKKKNALVALSSEFPYKFDPGYESSVLDIKPRIFRIPFL